MSVQCSLEQVQRMYEWYTVFDGCEVISQLGYGSMKLAVAGYDNRRKWTIDILKDSEYIFHDGGYVKPCGLGADHLLVQWQGGPPKNRQMFRGSFLMYIIDTVLYHAAINNEINNAVQAINAA